MTVPCDGGGVAAVAHLPEKLPAPVVVCSHGLLSSKASAKYQLLGEVLSEAGIAVVRFDFTGCGATEAPPAEDLIATRLRDLLVVIDFARSQAWAGEPLGLMGSSFGGYISLVAAAATKAPVRALACWSTPFDLERANLPIEDLEEIKRIYPDNFKLGGPVNLAGLPPLEGALIVHGLKDEVIPWGDSEEIYRTVGEPKQLLLLEDADHVFSDARHRRSAVDATRAWLRRRGF